MPYTHLGRLNITRNNLNEEICVQNLIESRVAQAPDAIALNWMGNSLTYNELNSRANKLAHYLRHLGIGPDNIIGVCMERSFEMVIGILGVLKAGGAYLPLDPSYPKDRISYILEDSGAKLVLTHEKTAGVIQKDGCQLISLDLNWSDISVASEADPEKITRSENLAYIIYTSGSTGKPKGVMITHSNLCQFIRIASETLDIYQKDKYLQTASIAYALSVRQLMIPLSCGSTLVLATADATRDPLALFDLIKRQNVTLMDMVPSFFHACIHRLSDLPEVERSFLFDNQLRRIVTVGEPLYWDIPNDWINKFMHSARIVNIFGQTETTGMVAAYPIQEGLPGLTGIVPIGKSILDTRLYILNSDLELVANGETGELCVSNPCIARGYLHQPELTKEKFIPNPFSDGFSDCLYRTGDLACVDKDGNIQFLGRGDHQVKIRGQRLELSEIEVALRQHSSIKECVVSVRGETPDDKFLVAYIVPFNDQNLSSMDLRTFLKQRLPDYMVPSMFLFLDVLPMTPNGKIDRLSLPDPRDVAITSSGKFYIDPRNDIERRVSTVWQELLNIESIGIHDDFFDLGGHSFLAVRLFSRIEQDLGVRLPLTVFFHATTIAQISALVEDRRQAERNWSPVVSVRTTGSNPPFFGVHGLEGGVLFWRDMFEYLPDNQPFYAIQAQGVDGLLPALTSIEEMSRLYIDEIRKIQPHGPYHLGGYSMGGVIAYEMGQQLIRNGEKVNSLVMFDTLNPKQEMALAVEASAMSQDVGSICISLKKLSWRIYDHVHRLLQLKNLKKQMAYISQDINYHIKRKFVYSWVSVLMIFGRRLPDTLLLSYLKFVHSQAVHKYVPSPYPGKVILFRASQSVSLNEDDSVLSWKSLTNGNIDIFHFEATHNITDREYANKIAWQLMECLSRSFIS